MEKQGSEKFDIEKLKKLVKQLKHLHEMSKKEEYLEHEYSALKRFGTYLSALIKLSEDLSIPISSPELREKHPSHFKNLEGIVQNFLLKPDSSLPLNSTFK